MKKRKHDNGVVTLEACIVMPMMILLMLMLNGLFVMFMGQQVVTHAVVQSAKSMAFDPYAIERVNSSDQQSLMTLFTDMFTIGNTDLVSTRKWYSDESSYLKTVAKNRFYGYLDRTQNNAKKLLDTLGVKSVSFSGCSVEDEDVLNLQISYKQEYMFSAGGLGTFDRTISVKVKLFKYEELPSNAYVVNLDANGGKVITNQITDQSNAALPTTTRTGYDFLGWSTNKNAKTPDIKDLAAAKAYGEASSGVTKLYAVWGLKTEFTKNIGSLPEITNYKWYGNLSSEKSINVGASIDTLIAEGYKMRYTVTGNIKVTNKGNVIVSGTGGDEQTTYREKGNYTLEYSVSGLEPNNNIDLVLKTVDGAFSGRAAFKISNLQVKVEFYK